MKTIVCRFVPRYYAINIFGTIWTRDRAILTPQLLNHESIHSAQQRELLWMPFYIIYFTEWLVLLIRYRRLAKAYRSVSFEREAYACDADLAYLEHRPRFAQWRKAHGKFNL